MFNSSVIEIVIGLSTLFFLVSVIASASAEGLETLLKMRAADLERGLRELLDDPQGKGLTKSLFDHPLIASLFAGRYQPNSLEASGERGLSWKERRTLPSYIPSASFAEALLDVIARGPSAPPAVDKTAPKDAAGGVDWVAAVPVPAQPAAAAVARPPGGPDVAGLRAAAAGITNERIRRVVLAAFDSAGDDLTKVKQRLEVWFDTSMDRVSGWFKRRTQWVLFGLGLFAAVALNIDPVRIANDLAVDDSLRAAVVAQAETLTSSGEPVLTYDKARDELAAIGFPIGWTSTPPEATCGATWWSCSSGFMLRMFFGWLITGLAVMLGAPFWFDIINKLVGLRSAVKPKKEEPPEASGAAAPPQPAVPPQPATAATTPAAAPVAAFVPHR